MNVYSVDKLIEETRRLATEYRRATGRPLAVTQELAKHDAARLLALDLVPEGEATHDALGTGSRAGWRIQIKGRAIFESSRSGARVGQIKSGVDWDSVILVLMDEQFEASEIYEATREAVVAALDGSAGSRRRGRGALSVARFKAIGTRVWARAEEAREGEAGAPGHGVHPPAAGSVD